MKTNANVLLILAAIWIYPAATSAGKEKPGQTKPKLSAVNAGQPYVLMNGNNVTSWTRSDGFFNWSVANSWNGEFPKASGVGTIFCEGIVFGGFVTDGLYAISLRVTGDTYYIGMQPGAMNADGTTDPNDPISASGRAFSVRSDMLPSIENDPTAWPDLTPDAASYNMLPQASVTDGMKSQIAAQYFLDWKEWPAAEGAPWYVDTVKQVRYDAVYDYANPHHIPGIPGATKTIWFVCNDANQAVSAQFALSPPIGMEEQMTIWCYASSTPLNNIIFKQVKLIYKGNPGSLPNSRIDSMYVVQWSDPDDGDSGDDYAGSDSLLSLAYVYNSKTTDAKYAAVGLPCPAAGYVFLQGVSQYTGNSGDSAIVDFKMRHGYKYFHQRNGMPRPLTSAVYFASGTPIEDPARGLYSGTLEWYNLMRSYPPRPYYPLGNPFYLVSPYASSHGIVTNYALSGDPVTGQGWIDGLDISAGDRRLVMTHGPFSMVKGDTAEVVIALVDGIGADNIGSVKVLKYNTTYAQFAFNNNFVLPSPPPSPKTSASALDQKVVLNWGSDAASVHATENGDNHGYVFEGYNVYQLPAPSASIDQGIRIATYDIVDNITVIVAPSLDPKTGTIVTKPVEFGSDNGISRSLVLTQDYLTQEPLHNGTAYYYAVTAYSYNKDWNNPGSVFQAPFPSLESPPVVIVAEPTSTKPGVRFGAAGGDSLAVVHTSSGGATVSDGSVSAVVVQPDVLTGDTYHVLFDTLGNWKVIDVTAGNSMKLSGTNQSGDADYLTVDGVRVIVQSPAPGMKSWSVPAGDRHFSPAGGFTGLGLEGFSSVSNPIAYDETAGTIGWANHFAFGGIGTTLTSPSEVHSVLLRTAAIPYSTLWDPLTVQTDPNFSFAYRYLRAASAPAAQPSFAPWILNVTSGYPYQDFHYGVPFSAWDIDVSPPVRLAVGFLENNVAGASVDGRYWPPQATGGDNTVNREFCFVFGTPYSTTPDPALQVNISNNSGLPIMWVMTCNIRNTNDWTSGDEFQMTAAKVNTPYDVFTFIAPKPTYSLATAQADIDKINVFPNPYYGVNPNETYRLTKHIRFTHLPAGATIRIFTLNGTLVKTLPTTDGTSTFADWNLRNENGLPVASGIYIAFIDIPSIGKTKTLKFAIVQEEQILPTY